MATYRNFQYTTPPHLTPVVSSFSSQNVDWPATNTLLDFVPRRPAKSVGTGAYEIIFNFGSATPIDVVFLNRTNYPSVKILADATTITPTGYSSGINGLNVPVDPDVNRRKLLVDMRGTTATTITIQVAASLTTDDGADYYSTGGITFGSVLHTFPDLMQLPFKVTVPQPATVREFPSGAKQVNQLGDRRAIMEFGGGFIDSHARSAAQAIDRVGLSPMILYPNIRMGDQAADAFDPSIAYLVRRTGDPSRGYASLPDLYESSWIFEECV